jgi:hypothetical protein
MESEINGQKYHYHNLVVLKDKPSLFHVVESRSWMEYCKNKITHPITEEERDYPYRECVRESQYVMNGAPSVAQQAVTPIVSTAVGSAGFVLGMQALGKGIAHSGSRTTNNNTTSAAGGSGGDASSSSSSTAKGGLGGTATNNVNSGNKTTTTNQNHTVHHNNSHTNINSNNHLNAH